MDDFERYGDYNEVDEAPTKSRTLLVIKIVAAVICIVVTLIIGIRLFTFNYYPDSMKRIVFTPTLTEHYEAMGGDISAITQSLRAPYDDNNLGNFFASNLIVIKDAGEIQITVRYNVSLSEVLSERYYKSDFDPDDISEMSFRLWRDGYGDNSEGEEIGALTVADFESFAMYRYVRLVFDGVDFPSDESEEKIEWIRLEINIDGAKLKTGDPHTFMIPIYENNEEHNTFTEYKLTSKERP